MSINITAVQAVAFHVSAAYVAVWLMSGVQMTVMQSRACVRVNVVWAAHFRCYPSVKHAYAMQVAVLANIPEQQVSSDSASEDDMGEELQACLAGSEEAESAPAKPVSHHIPWDSGCSIA